MVLGADGIAVLGAGSFPFVTVRTKKIIKCGRDVLIATTGDVGLRKRFEHIVSTLHCQSLFDKNCLECATTISKAVVDAFRDSRVPCNEQTGYDLGALIAVPFGGIHELVEFSQGHLQPEIKDENIHFASMGAAQNLSDPFLAFISRVIWGEREPEDVLLAKVGVLWTLRHAAYSPTAVTGPFRLGVLLKEDDVWKADILEQTDFDETSRAVNDIEDRFPEFVRNIISRGTVQPAPQIPTDEPI